MSNPTWLVNHKSLGHYLRQQREGAGMGITEVARHVRVKRIDLLKLEAGREHWTVEKMDLYLEALNLP